MTTFFFIKHSLIKYIKDINVFNILDFLFQKELLGHITCILDFLFISFSLLAVIKKQFLIFPDINLISKKRFFSTPPPSIEGLKNIKFFSFSWLVNVIF